MIMIIIAIIKKTKNAKKNTGRLVRSGRMRVGASLAQAGPW